MIDAVLNQVDVEVLRLDGSVIGVLKIRTLRDSPWNGAPLLVDHREDLDVHGPAAPVQLLEESVYEYEVSRHGQRNVAAIEPPEVVSPSRDASRGRIETGRWTGTVEIVIRFECGDVGVASVEVRSRKVDYETEYRSMLLSIARRSAELTQSAFSASALRAFQPNVEADPDTVYQRFAFMSSLVSSLAVDSALDVIGRTPHHEHEFMLEEVNSARGCRSSSRIARELQRQGPRQRVSAAPGNLDSLPSKIRAVEFVTTFDTVPNRFVRYVVERWRSLAVEVRSALDSGSAPNSRGRREADAIIDRLDRALATPVLAEAGHLSSFPHSNQVLQGRAGYREVFEAFLLAEAAATITWEARDRLFSAGQRNVAELYEYWTYLELVRIIGTLEGFVLDDRSLIRTVNGGAALDLHRGRAVAVVARGWRRGIRVDIEVWFNRFFKTASFGDAIVGIASGVSTSWSVAMHPDCSIRISLGEDVESAGSSDRGSDTDVWLHFDAKYRIDRFGADEVSIREDDDGVSREGRLRPKATDLMKMHAYRDAIRHSVGAYVLYPGDSDAPLHRRQYEEVVPGLGAFVLRPASDGQASAASEEVLCAFLDDVVEHVASAGTALARVRYWTDIATSSGKSARIGRSRVLRKPAQDTTVLLAYAKGIDHFEWIRSHGVYNLRADVSRSGSVGADAPSLAADFVAVYNDAIEVFEMFPRRPGVSVQTSVELEQLGYPKPGGNAYLCLTLSAPILTTCSDLGALAELARQRSSEGRVGAPALVTWFDLAPFVVERRIDE